MNELDSCKAKMEELEFKLELSKNRINGLEEEVYFLKTHPTLVRGMKGEKLICRLTGGQRTKYASKYDVLVKDEIKLEIKTSKLNRPTPKDPNYTRWGWSKPLGYLNKFGDYDFLVLMGQKDRRYMDQYLDDSPYACFLIPRKNVGSIMTSGKTIGANVQLSANLKSVRSKISLEIKKHMEPMREILELIANAK